MMNSWFLIANPTSGNGKLSKKWKAIEQLLQAKNIEFTANFTEFAKQEIALVHEAIQQGFRNFISVGGDGTLHNIVNGIMSQSYIKTSDVTVGVIPLGTGNDWIKTHNIPNDIEKSVEIIAKKNTILQDIGKLELENSIAYTNNVAGLGFDGYVTEKLTNYKHLGPISYLISGILGLVSYKPTLFKIETDNETIETKCLLTLFGICKFSGGNMQMVPYKSATDGKFAITIAKNIGLFDLLFNLKKMFNGKILQHKKVVTLYSNSIKVTPPKDTLTYIQADGELVGSGKVKATVLPKVLGFVVS